ncbi:MAG: hypothetical protein J6O51_03175 [Bacteroidales bacterium]|nr:hypothetical protein [Bacteroidales bacterium]
MRHFGLFAFIAAFSCWAISCQSLTTEEPLAGPGTLSATFETLPSTKTGLFPAGGGSYKVLWSAKDMISVFPDAQQAPYIYQLTAGEGTEKGTFSGYGTGSSYIAYYPGGSSVGRKSADEISVVLPVEQNYIEGSFDQGASPMAAYAEGQQLSFKNLASILKLSVTGHHTVTRIVFRPKDKSFKVSGPAVVSFANPAAPALSVGPEGADSLCLNTGRIVVTDGQACDFYLVLPAGEYKGGFTVRIYTTSGYMDKTCTSDFTMERSKVHEAEAFAIKLSSGTEPSTELEGLGTKEQPFIIASLSDLLLLQYAVNTPDGTIKSKSGGVVPAAVASYRMTADIDLSPACGSGNSWTPIGNIITPFSGDFDGGSHTISSLYINAPNEGRMGLFGYVLGSLVNINIFGTIEDAGDEAGLLVGEFQGLTLKNCSSSGKVTTNNSIAGGLAGIASGEEVSGCTNHANVSAPIWRSQIGGIAGAAANISDCFNDGQILGDDYVGGICGTALGYVTGCINNGTINGYNEKCGGIVGLAYANVANCVNTGRVEASKYLGGIVGQVIEYGVYNCANFGVVSVSQENGGGIVGLLGGEDQGQAVNAKLGNCVGNGSFTNYSERIVFIYKDAKNFGGICGKNSGQAEYGYWLHDPAESFKVDAAVGLENGSSSALFALSPAQMKGADSGTAMYGGKTKVVDALNAWVSDNQSLFEKGFKEWTYDSKTGYPTLK